MKNRTVRLCTYTLAFLVALFGLAAQAGAQDNTFNQLSGSPQLRGKTGKAHKRKGVVPASGYTYEVLYSFKHCPDGGPCTDGEFPNGGLILDGLGNLYGTTQYGGINKGAGTVFRLDSAGNETVLYSFCVGSGEPCPDGEFPLAGLLRDAAGNLYGTTEYGGPIGVIGYGTVFKMDTTGHEAVLYSFCSQSNCTDGAGPMAGLIQDAAGGLYGTTTSGGANNSGTVFKLDSTGHEAVLYSFCSKSNCTDGSSPYQSDLIRDSAGNLYGTTIGGGANGHGTVFKVDNTGHETVLYSFCSASGCADGNAPYAGVIQDTAGNFYGTTAVGGISNANCPNGCGTVFKLDNTGHETVLYSFCSASGCADGAEPSGGVIQDTAGNLYGTTGLGGISSSNCSSGCGTVFKLDSTGHETVLYNFCSSPNCTDGFGPGSGLTQDAAGNLYGTAAGGANGGGLVFELSTGGQGTATVTLTSSPNPAFVDQSVILSAVVSGSGATPTGTVTFEEGSTSLGTVTLANGKANLTTSFTSAGGFSIVASYSGDQNYKAANSSPITQVVNQYTTSTHLASSLNPSIYGQAVTFTATVSSAGPTPTGTVTFVNGKKALGSATLSGGVAQFTTSTLKVGTLKITASYGGDAANAGSTSPVLKQVVSKATSTTSLTSSPNPSKVGQTVKFTATVTSPTTTPTGKVTFKDGSTALGTVSIKKGVATYSTSALSAGSHNITAVYAGTGNISGSTSPVLVQVVN